MPYTIESVCVCVCVCVFFLFFFFLAHSYFVYSSFGEFFYLFIVLLFMHGIKKTKSSMCLIYNCFLILFVVFCMFHAWDKE